MHTPDMSSLDPASVGHEGKVTASILLSFLTFGTTYPRKGIGEARKYSQRKKQRGEQGKK
jgi:hypothetical protein